MSASIRSSHTQPGRQPSRLEIDLTLEDAQAGQTVCDTISFDVPSDFHSHNDSVAAALMTLIGARYPVVRFDFPISERCALLLRDHYGVLDVGPVDVSLAPRQRGSSLGLMFSGGLDSLAMWMILNRALGNERFKVITTTFGGGYTFEEFGYAQVSRDISCRTNFRQKRYDRSGRFTGAVPLLFADYLDLDSVVTGHLFNHPPLSLEALIDGRAPRYLLEDRPFLAGGLGEIHIGRALGSIAPLWIAAQGDPERFESCWRGSSPPGSVKHFKKGLMLRLVFEQLGERRPAWLDNIPEPRRTEHLLDSPESLIMTLYMLSRTGTDPYRRFIRDLSSHDFRSIAGLRFTFIERYNPNVIGRLPESLKTPVTLALHHWGIYPYDERDWCELGYVRRLSELAAAGGTRLGTDAEGRSIEPFRWEASGAPERRLSRPSLLR